MINQNFAFQNINSTAVSIQGRHGQADSIKKLFVRYLRLSKIFSFSIQDFAL